MGYSEALAYIHDAGFTSMARSAAARLIRLLREQKVRNGLVIDLGCGSGVLAERLTRAGYDVYGIDISESMVKLARKRAPKAEFVCGSLFRARFPKCVAITAVGECVSYLFDRGPTSLSAFFARVHHALTPGGIFLFDVAAPGRAAKPCSLHVEGKNWAVLVDKTEDVKRRLLIRRITIFRRVGRLYRRSEEVHRLRLYPLAQIVSELQRVGFRVSRLPGYGREHFGSGTAVFMARKP